MKDDYAEAIAGESAVVHFSATIEPRIHTVTRIDSGKEEDVSSQFIIKKDTITLCNAKVTDSGLYKISCCDDNGVKGEKTFTLKIKHGKYIIIPITLIAMLLAPIYIFRFLYFEFCQCGSKDG